MDFWIGFLFCFSLYSLGVVGCAVFNLIDIYPYPLRSRVYVIGSDDIIYECYFLGGDIDHEDGNFYYHFLSCDDFEIGWALFREEIATDSFVSYRRAEKALKKRNISDD